MKKGLFLAASTMLMVVASPAVAQNIVTNGGFETGNFNGWSLGNSSQYVSVSTGQYAYQGTYGAQFGTIGSNTTLTQALTTQAGQYNISFALANLGNTPNFFSVAFNGQTLNALTNSNPFGYTVFNYTGTATGGTSNLVFTFRQDPSYFGLDSVSVTRVAPGVPEPATWAMMIAGFGMVGGALRRRSSAVAFAA